MHACFFYLPMCLSFPVNNPNQVRFHPGALSVQEIEETMLAGASTYDISTVECLRQTFPLLVLSALVALTFLLTACTPFHAWALSGPSIELDSGVLCRDPPPMRRFSRTWPTPNSPSKRRWPTPAKAFETSRSRRRKAICSRPAAARRWRRPRPRHPVGCCKSATLPF